MIGVSNSSNDDKFEWIDVNIWRQVKEKSNYEIIIFYWYQCHGNGD